MEKSQFFLISAYDGEQWQDDEVVQHTPIPRVRQLLGGRWDTSKQYHPFVKAFFNGQKRVLVMGFPPEKTEAEVAKALDEIRLGREDRN